MSFAAIPLDQPFCKMPVRRKCPVGFTCDKFVGCLQQGDLSSHVSRLRATPTDAFFRVDLSLGQDRDALYMYRTLLTNILLANPSGIVRKQVMRDGLKRFEADNCKFLRCSPEKIRISQQEKFIYAHLHPPTHNPTHHTTHLIT